MATTKRKITLSLDAAGLVELEQFIDPGETLSSLFNDAMHERLAFERRQSALRELLDGWTETHGPVDRDGVEHFKALLA